jgi:flagellar hook-associated protein FlgK|tara:strand:+ start:242 stop:463 length:222 start_codon:yes stop_codon:yes gene_type:complete
MSDTLKVEGHTHLIRDVNSNAIINTNQSEYQLYMKRVKVREKQADELRNTVKEINNLKSEIREIKQLIKEIVK